MRFIRHPSQVMLHSLMLGWCLLAAACSTIHTPQPGSAPVFRLDGLDQRGFQSLVRRQDALIAKCSATNSCDQAYFNRGLTALFEHRDSAISNFQKVVSIAPKGKLAQVSQVWLQLLRSGPDAEDGDSWISAHWNAQAIARERELLNQAVESLARELLIRQGEIQQIASSKESDLSTVETLQRELSERQKKIEELAGKKEPPRPGSDPAMVQALQAQLEQRDKKIEELTNQLEALKRIDQEMREKARPMRPPAPPAPLPLEVEPKP
jgi:(p)ppGpp synthase/HD superfamily hydrolase